VGVDAGADPREGRDLFVDPERGDDANAGTQPDPAGDDGPLATLDVALDSAYDLAAEREDAEDAPGFVNVWLRGGRYRRSDPLEVGPDGTSIEIRFRAYPDEHPIVTGNRVIEGWEAAEVNGVDAWKTTVPEGSEGSWYFRQLFVDGERRHRPRLPEDVDEVLEGEATATSETERFYEFGDGTPSGGDQRTFEYEEGSLDPDWRNLGDIDIVAMNKWYSELMPIESFDLAAGQVTVAYRPYIGKDWRDRFYYVENVFEALGDPGDWYLDRENDEVIYVPRECESIGEVTIAAPRTERLLDVAGDPEEGGRIEGLRIEGITFEGTTWERLKQLGQSAPATPSAVSLRHVHDGAFVDCTIRSVGGYGFALRGGCSNVTVAENEITDVGAGGMKVASNALAGRVNSYREDAVEGAPTGNNRIVDNWIHDIGRVFHMGVGILAMDTYGNEIAHNEVNDTYYTAISCGWEWSYDDTLTDGNRIARNHTHDLGQGVLSDMGGVYTLGRQPNTVVTSNYIHDVEENDYGGWGLYPDQASMGILWEDNLVHDVLNGIHLHWGSDNRFQNNVLARSRDVPVKYSRHNPGEYSEYGMRLDGNVLVAEGTPIFSGGYAWNIDEPGLASDNNLLWNRDGDIEGTDWWDTWTGMGRDGNSVIDDPAFADPDNDDFSLTEESPALDTPVSFDPFDLSDVGPRTPFPPSMPVCVTATASEGTVELDWQSVEGATGYRIKRAPADGGPYETIGETDEPGYTDEDVGNGSYEYAVSAVGAGEAESDPSHPTPVEMSGNAEPTDDTDGTTTGADEDVTASPDEGATASPDGTDGTATPGEEETSTPGTPGFGVPSALGAAALAAWRLSRTGDDRD
jgi:hypothetical protein